MSDNSAGPSWRSPTSAGTPTPIYARPSPLEALRCARLHERDGERPHLTVAERTLAALKDARYVVVPREDFLEVLSAIDHNNAFTEQDAAERLRNFMRAEKGSGS